METYKQCRVVHWRPQRKWLVATSISGAKPLSPDNPYVYISTLYYVFLLMILMQVAIPVQWSHV